MGDWGTQARVEEAQRFVDALFAFASPESYVELRLLERGRPAGQRWFRVTEAASELSWAVDRSSTGADVYVGVQPRARMGGGTRDDVHSIVAVVADLDCGVGKALASKEEAKQRLAVFAGTGLPASLVVDSGGGLHAYWRFSEAVETTERELVESIGLGLARRLDSDPSVRDLARILRLPGTLNWKRRSPRPVRLLRCRSSQLHLMDLEHFAGLPTRVLSESCEVAASSRGPAARLVAPRLAAVLQRMGLAVRSKCDGTGSVLIIESPCPLCPGFPAQQTPPRAGSAHVTPSGTLKCKRMKCAAGPMAAPLGLSFDEWSSLLPSGVEAAAAVLRHRAPRSTLMGVRKLVHGLRPAVVGR